jgi:hypothetical protein
MLHCKVQRSNAAAYRGRFIDGAARRKFWRYALDARRHAPWPHRGEVYVARCDYYDVLTTPVSTQAIEPL